MFVFFAGVFDPIHLIQQSKLWFFKIEAPNMYGKVSVERCELSNTCANDRSVKSIELIN